MSTRATYKIGHQTFYIHHDGYQEGAAMYFYNMVAESHRNIYAGTEHEKYNRSPSGGYECHFLRANSGAEFTENHQAHGDTEFRYTLDIDKMELTVSSRVGWSAPSWIKETFKLVDFINKYHDEKIRVVNSRYGHLPIYHTTKSLSDEIKQKESLLNTWKEKQGDNLHANTLDLIKEVQELKMALFGKVQSILNKIK